MASNQITLERSIEINSPDYLYQCTKCNKVKPNSEYSVSLNKRVENSLGRAFVSQCKSCRANYNSSRKVLDRKKELAPIQRNKHRLTWKNEFIQFDLTKVEQTQKVKPTKTLLEFEMELTHPLLQARTKKFTDEEKNSLYIAFFKFLF
jgi:hypothetical protein